MSAIAVVLAIACCLAIAGGGAIADRPRRPRHGGAVVLQSTEGHEGFFAGFNAILLRVAVVLAVVMAMASTREGSQAAALIVAHPEWFTPVNVEMPPALSEDGGAEADFSENPGP